MTKLVLFDFDGTIADTMPKYAEIAADVLCKHLGMERELALEAYYDTAGVPFREQALEIAPPDFDRSLMVKEYEERKNNIVNIAEPFEDVKRVISIVKTNKKVGIVSSNSGNFVTRCLQRWEMLNTFDWVSGLGIYADKRQQIRVAIEEFGITREDVLYIGDSVYDQKLAHDMGISFALVHSDKTHDLSVALEKELV